MKNIAAINWEPVYQSLSNKGYAIIPELLSPEECESLQHLYHEESLYRSTINMQRYRFGKGEYKYFRYPLPDTIQKLRTELYEPLVPLANEWMKWLSLSTTFPAKHTELINLCHTHQQLRPTPLILRYEAEGYNTLHQDLYGEIYFPLQALIVLSQYRVDFEGGEFVMTEQVPRAQSKAEVITPNRGDLVIFTTNFRPVKGTKGYYRAAMRHGISAVKSGERYAMGVIFHDAQ